MEILNLIREISGSDTIIHKVFLDGSCFRLFKILELIYPDAKPWYSHSEGHWITEIDGGFYDIGGRISQKYVSDYGYEHITDNVMLQSAYIHTHSNNISTNYRKYEKI